MLPDPRPHNGASGYDAGALEITNNTAGPVTLNAVTVDFGGGSSPSHFDLWTGTGMLPQSVPVGTHVVMTEHHGLQLRYVGPVG